MDYSKSKVLVLDETGNPSLVSLADLAKALSGNNSTPTPAPTPVPTPIPTPTPAPVVNTKTPTNEDLIGALAGYFNGQPVYVAKNGKPIYYQLTEGKLWPRGTNIGLDNRTPGMSILSGNNNPNNQVGVPKDFALETGWGWFKSASDGAFAIVPQTTSELGPSWLQKAIPTNQTNTKTDSLTDWRYPNQTT